MMYFTLQWPLALPLLGTLIPLAMLLAYARRKRGQLLEQVKGGVGSHRKPKDMLRLIAIGILLFCLARPGYAPTRHAVSKSGRDVVFAVDVSQSMLATDAYPSRLEASLQAVRDALTFFDAERVGLIVYAGSSTIMCPLTYDYDFVRYMLEGVHTRTVDFGGTTLLSAVEKAVDQVFLEGRGGFQDLIVLTDGEDHAPDSKRIVKVLEGSGVNMMLIGVGGRNGSRIPVSDESGGVAYLTHEGSQVYTKIDNETLQRIASSVKGARYFEAGTRPVDFKGFYSDYAQNLPRVGSEGDESIVVYKEAAFFLLPLAFLLLLFSERRFSLARSSAHLAVVLLATFSLSDMEAETEVLSSLLSKAVEMHVEGRMDEAIEGYEELMGDTDVMSREDASLVFFNSALAYYQMSVTAGEESPHLGLEYMEMARNGFLESMRVNPALQRAGMRLDAVVGRIAELEATIAEEAKKEQELQERLDKLIEALELLLADQGVLRTKVLENDPNRNLNKKRGQAAPKPVEPGNAAALSDEYFGEQGSLRGRASVLREEMFELDKLFSEQNVLEDAEMDTIMTEPLRLMQRVLQVKEEAAEQLKLWQSWARGRERQSEARRLIEAIIQLLQGNSNSSDSDDSDYYEEEEDWDFYEDGEMDESYVDSVMQEGDFASASEMQPLPVPNYSLDEILKSEVLNQQFREQERVKANASKVKKDW